MNQEVHIRWDPGSPPQVDPPVLRLQSGDTVEFIPEEGVDLKVWVPYPGVFPNQQHQARDPGGKILMRVNPASERAQGHGWFPYAVFCRRVPPKPDLDFAVGNSPPSMVIDDPDPDTGPPPNGPADVPHDVVDFVKPQPYRWQGPEGWQEG